MRHPDFLARTVMPIAAPASESGLPSVGEAARLLSQGTSSSFQLVSRALAHASQASGEGQRVFTQRYDERAREEARGWDLLRSAGTVRAALAGLPVTVKDLFDVAGQVTTAGSRVLADRAPAAADAEAVARLRRAGAVIVGKTNMTEFAFSGLGLNPHYGTPRNPFDRARGRIPGGSSSGAAVSVTDGMAVAAIGTDTGGSVRIPAALCGLVGFKPTAARIPRTGVVPLSRTLDSVGPIGRSVECCAVLDAVLAGIPAEIPAPVGLQGLRVAVARTVVWDEIEPLVSAPIERALTLLSRAGAQVTDLPLTDLKEIPAVNANGGFSAAEAFAWHRELIERRSAEYDPRVLTRIERGRTLSAADYLDLIDARERIQRSFERALGSFDLWLHPTVPCVAMEIAALNDDNAYVAANRLMLRNPSLVNFLDACAISIPCHPPGSAPVGLSLVARHGEDRRLLAIARAVAPVVAAS